VTTKRFEIVLWESCVYGPLKKNKLDHRQERNGEQEKAEKLRRTPAGKNFAEVKEEPSGS